MKTIRCEQSTIDNEFYRLVRDYFRGNLRYFIQKENGFDKDPDYVKSFVHRIDAEIAFDELVGKEVSASRLLIR